MVASMVRFGGVERRPDAWRAAVLLLVACTSCLAACTTNHDALARRPSDDPKGGNGGAAGLGGTGGFGNSGNQPQGGRPNPDYEPPGDDVLTIVNGVIDAASVRLCFARVAEQGGRELVGEPLPELAYAASTMLTELDGVSLADDSVQVWVIAGELERVAELDCEAAIELAESEEAKVTPDALLDASGGAGGAAGSAGAGGVDSAGAGGAAPQEPLPLPTLRARPVAALPPGTVDIGRSILLVLTGCMGGAAYTDNVERAACGEDYAPDRPTLQPIVVKLSRDLRFDKVGLQAVHASLSTGSIDVRAASEDSAAALVFASTVAFGGIEPRPADTRFTAVELGVDRDDYGLQAIDDMGDEAFAQSWPEILQRSAVESLEAARTYTVVFLGPDPRLIKRGFWQHNAFAIVDNDPTRE
jgi:hypothetical protein